MIASQRHSPHARQREGGGRDDGKIDVERPSSQVVRMAPVGASQVHRQLAIRKISRPTKCARQGRSTQSSSALRKLTQARGPSRRSILPTWYEPFSSVSSGECGGGVTAGETGVRGGGAVGRVIRAAASSQALRSASSRSDRSRLMSDFSSATGSRSWGRLCRFLKGRRLRTERFKCCHAPLQLLHLPACIPQLN